MNQSKWMNVFYKFCIGLGVGIIFSVAYLLINRRFGLMDFSNGMFLAAFFVIIVGLCSFVTNQGFFDVISYGFSTIPFMFHITNERKYEDLVAYRDAKVEKRSSNNISWLGYEFSGLFFLIVSLILYLIFKYI